MCGSRLLTWGWCFVPLLAMTVEANEAAVCLENDYVKYVIGTDGRNLHFVDKRSGVDYCDRQTDAPFARVTTGGTSHGASVVSGRPEHFEATFGDTGVKARFKGSAFGRYLILEVLSVEGEGVEQLTLVDIPLTLEAKPGEPFAACALALNLQTNVWQIPQPSRRLTAMCYPRFGLGGAEVALIGCPGDQLRSVMQEVVRSAEDLPMSAVGGPWALDSPANQGSYLFNFSNLSEKTVGDWIELAKSLGINQIDFHGGNSFRFGDCRPNPETYPNGRASLKAVIDRLHEAGIMAGLHTYAFFVAKDSQWVTPVPDPRLGKDATYTLADALSAEATTVPVVESTQGRSLTTGFFVRNSLTLQIDDELIVYSGFSPEPPYAFTQCQRGAHGTHAAPHETGAKVHHLKQCFYLFCPDGDSTLLAEVAARTADVYNECGFDMMYLDALDGEGILGGNENGWHYGSKFVFEIMKHVKKPPIMEMSTFHHHLWYVRSRMGAWDHPTRSHKAFIDVHNQYNAGIARTFLPGHLGWWAVKTFTDIQGEPTFTDDIEYLCGKCIGHGVGFSVMGINPDTVKTIPAYNRLGQIMKRYEALRHSNYFDEPVRTKLAEPGKEFTLVQQSDGKWRFHRIQYAKHKVAGLDGWSNVWPVDNPFDEQPIRLRIEALYSAGSYDSGENITLADFASAAEFGDRASADGVTADLEPATVPPKAGNTGGSFSAVSTGKSSRNGAWTKAGKTFAPPIDLEKHQATGLWVHGDGRGQVLNLQVRSPDHLTRGIADHYITVDFTGWRYVELIEPEGERYADFAWPYGSPYEIYRENVQYKHVESLSLWYNNLPANGKVVCQLSAIKALPLIKTRLVNPSILVDGKKIVFPVEIETGSYLEFDSDSGGKLYGPNGELIREVVPQGEVPLLRRGGNKLEFTCDGPVEVNPRVKITVIARGPAI